MSRENEIITLAADIVDLVDGDEDTTTIEGIALALALIIFDRSRDHNQCLDWMQHVTGKMVWIIDEASASNEGKHIRGKVQKILSILR